MGVSASVPLDPAFQTIASWPWSKVQSALKAYADGDYDFCIDADTLADITCLSDADTNRLVNLLCQNKSSGVVNALTLLICIVLIGDSSQPNVDIRLEALFDLIDFSSVSSITIHELSILLLMISTAMASIVGRKDSAPSDKTIQRASGVIYEALDKVHSLSILKSEFILWATSILDELPTNKLDTIFNTVFIKGVGITGNNGNKKHGVSNEPDLPNYRKEEQENDDFKGDVEVAEVTTTGNLIVKLISLSKVKGSDVYVTLRLGDGAEWAQSTDLSPNDGGDIDWKFDPNDMCGTVMASYLSKNVINLTVKDSNESSADKYIGKAKLCMEELLSENNSNKLVTLTGHLQSHDEPGYSAGEYTVKLKFVVPKVNEGGVSEDGSDDVQEDETSEDLAT